MSVEGGVHYFVSIADARSHEFRVSMRFGAGLPGWTGRLRLAAWIPGSYMIRDFARHVTGLVAHDWEGALVVRKIDKDSWSLPPCKGEVRVDYTVYAFDLSVRGAYLDHTRAFFNGSALFLCAEGAEPLPWECNIEAPPDGPGSWRVATALPTKAVAKAGFGCYAGQGYEHLIDCPVEIGDFIDTRFLVEGIAHRIVVTDGGRFDAQRLGRDVARICREHAALFRCLPVERYEFLGLATLDGYGGLEHRDSTSLIFPRADLPAMDLDQVGKPYRRLLGLFSHEYFHLWHVKRIQPAVFRPLDLMREVHTELLWVFEGFTSYYDDLALLRSGILDPEQYLDQVAINVSRTLRGAGRFRQSIAESSFDAWTKFYKQDENAANAIVSYYVKGGLVALGLDMTLRVGSDDRLCLDDLMRRLWERFGSSGRGLTERGLEAEVAGLLGYPLDEFFTDYVYGTVELPFETWFSHLGVGCRIRAAGDAQDTGGYVRALEPRQPGPALGARFEVQPGGALRLTQVTRSGAAERAGLAAGDTLIAVAGERALGSNIDDLLRRHVGCDCDVHFFRRDLLLTTSLQLGALPLDTCDLTLDPPDHVDPACLLRRQAWMSSLVSDAK